MKVLDKSIIGRTSQPMWVDVEKGAIRRFAEAIGDPHPAYREGEAAPPTFPTTFGYPPIPSVELDLARVLHAEQEFEYQRPLRAGDRLQVQMRVADYKERGTTAIIVFESESRDADGSLVCRGRSTIFIR